MFNLINMKNLKKLLFLPRLVKATPFLTLQYLSAKHRHIKQPLRSLAIAFEFPYYFFMLFFTGIKMFKELLFSEQELRKKVERTLKELGIDNPQELREGKIKIKIRFGRDGRPSSVEVIRKATEKK